MRVRPGIVKAAVRVAVALAGLAAVAAPVAGGAAERPAGVLGVLHDELEHSFAELRAKADPPQYFMLYQVAECRKTYLEAAGGALRERRSERHQAGHPVMFSSRNPENLKSLVAGLGPLAQAGTVAEAIAFGDVVLIVIPYAAMEQIGQAHAGALAQKVLVMDVSNPIARRDGEDFVKSVGAQGGPGLVTAEFLPGARIVRAFNAIGAGRLAELAQRAGNPVGVPIAGDDSQAIAVAQSLIREIGFEPVLVGGWDKGKYLVPGTPLAGELTPAEIRQIAGGLQ